MWNIVLIWQRPAIDLIYVSVSTSYTCRCADFWGILYTVTIFVNLSCRFIVIENNGKMCRFFFFILNSNLSLVLFTLRLKIWHQAGRTGNHTVAENDTKTKETAHVNLDSAFRLLACLGYDSFRAEWSPCSPVGVATSNHVQVAFKSVVNMVCRNQDVQFVWVSDGYYRGGRVNYELRLIVQDIRANLLFQHFITIHFI